MQKVMSVLLSVVLIGVVGFTLLNPPPKKHPNVFTVKLGEQPSIEKMTAFFLADWEEHNYVFFKISEGTNYRTGEPMKLIGFARRWHWINDTGLENNKRPASNQVAVNPTPQR